MNPAALHAAKKKKKDKAKAANEIRAENARATTVKRSLRMSEPLPQRAPLGDISTDFNRRHSEPPPPPPPPPPPSLASTAAVKKSERNQTEILTYDSMPTHPGYRRKRSREPAAAAASTMGHAYVDAAVVSSGIASLSQSKCEHCGSRHGVAVAGETQRAIGGGSFDFACVECGCLCLVPLSSRHGKQQDEAAVRFIAAATTEGMGKSEMKTAFLRRLILAQ